MASYVRDALLQARATGAHGDENRGPPYQAFLIVMTVVVIIAIVIRFWSRALAAPEGRVTPRYWWDDWVALAAVPFALASFGLCFAMVHFGLGRHFVDIEPANTLPFFTVLFAVYFAYDTALVLLKASALLFYARIFLGRQYHATWFSWCLYLTHFLNIAWYLGIVFSSAFMCKPIAKSWNPTLEGHCGSTPGLWLGSAIPSVAIDLIILLLPLPMIWSLKMNKARKLGIMAIFVCGYCVIIVSLGRLITVIQNQKELEADITWGGVPILYWLCSEVTITLVSICLPATVHLGRRLAKNYFSPLASRITSIFSSRGGTMDRGTSSQSHNAVAGNNLRMRTSARKAGFETMSDDKSIVSMESRRHILLDQRPGAYSAHVYNGHTPDADVPDHEHIYVKNDVSVARH